MYFGRDLKFQPEITTLLRKSDKVDGVFIIFENEIIGTPPAVELARLLAPINLNILRELVILLYDMTRSRFHFKGNISLHEILLLSFQAGDNEWNKF